MPRWIFLILSLFLPVQGWALLIYPLGDSITQGIDHVGYRQFLYEKLKSSQIPFHFIGSQTDGPADFPEPGHEGHGGWTIEDVNEEINGWMKIFAPDVVLLMLGSNDIEDGILPREVSERMELLLERLTSARPFATIFVAELTLIKDSVFDARAVQLNAIFKDLVRQRSHLGQKLIFVPMHDALAERHIVDLDHPTSEGNRILAERWHRAILTWLQKLN